MGPIGPVPMLARPRWPAKGIDNEQMRDPGFLNDALIRRDHTPNWPTDNKHGVGDPWVNWTDCGPTRPELHSRIVNWRVMAGTSNTRYIPNPYDGTVGLHSRTARPPMGNIQRYQAGASTIRPGRQNRLTQGTYNGQSYSQTTKMQGSR
jgi:hypothetical protein